MSVVLTKDSPMIDWALTYINKNGWSVFPVYEAVEDHDGQLICACSKGAECRSPGKHPRIQNGVLNATNDARQIREWWLKWPNANIGVAAGKSGLFIIDDDCAKNGYDSLNRLANEGKTLPSTWKQKTGSGGWHHIYKAPENLAQKNGSANVLREAGYPGIDTRYGNGYVLLAPSNHVSGGKYKLTSAREIVDAPDWFVQLEAACRQKTTSDQSTPEAAKTYTPRSIDEMMQGWRDGEKHSTGVAVGGAFSTRGVPLATAVLIMQGLARIYANPEASDISDDQIAEPIYSAYKTYPPKEEKEAWFMYERGLIADKDVKGCLRYWANECRKVGYKDMDAQNILLALAAMNPDMGDVSGLVAEATFFRPRIDISVDRQQQHDRGMSALAAANRRGDVLGALYRSHDGKWVQIRRHTHGSLEIVQLTRDSLVGKLQACADWGKNDKDGNWKSGDIPSQVVQTITSAPLHDRNIISGDLEQAFPILDKVLTKPYGIKGRLVYSNAPYYIQDAEAALMFDSEICETLDESLENVSKGRAQEAERKLRGIFAECRFKTESDWHKALALILTAYIRHSIKGSWGWAIITSASQGEGKTTLAQGILAFCQKTALGTLADNDDENRKTFAGWLENGVDGVILDNLTGFVRSDNLARILTDRKPSLRANYGKSAIPYTNDLIVIGTANNPNIDRDLVSRGIQIRLDGGGKPRTNVSMKLTPAEYINANQAKIHGWVWDILLYAANANQSSSESVALQHRYFDWEKKIRRILSAIDIRLDLGREDLQEADPHTQAFETLVRDWWSEYGDQEVEARKITIVGMDCGGRALLDLFRESQLRSAAERTALGEPLPFHVQATAKIVSQRRDTTWLAELPDVMVTIQKRKVKGIAYYRLARQDGKMYASAPNEEE